MEEKTLSKKMDSIHGVTADLLKNLAERKSEEMTVDLGMGFLLSFSHYYGNVIIKLPCPAEIDGEILDEVVIETRYYSTDNPPYDIMWEDVEEDVNMYLEDIVEQMFYRCLRVGKDFIIDGGESESKSEQGVVYKATKSFIRDFVSMKRDCCIDFGAGVKLCTFNDNYFEDFKMVLKLPCDEVVFYSEDYYSQTPYDSIRLGRLAHDINHLILECLEPHYDVIMDMGSAWIVDEKATK